MDLAKLYFGFLVNLSVDKHVFIVKNQALASHLMLLHLLRDRDSAALWMDTTGDFSVEKLTTMLDVYEKGTSVRHD